MHQLYFVKVATAPQRTSEGARKVAVQELENNGFTGIGYFGGGRADWYVVGGRWSGVLVGKEDENRDSYEELGYEDDAVLIDSPVKAAEVMNTLAKDYGDVEVFDVDNCEETDITTVLTRDKAPYWLVAIDYHS